MNRLVPTVALFLVLAGLVMAQRRSRGFGGGGGGGESYVGEHEKTAREVQSHSTGTPVWENPKAFQKDVFTFVRVRRGRSPYGDGGGWATDTPDADLNLSYRLQQMTSMRVDPDGRFI